MWVFIVSSQSRWMPRSRTNFTGQITVVPVTSVRSKSDIFSSIWREPNHISSVCAHIFAITCPDCSWTSSQTQHPWPCELTGSTPSPHADLRKICGYKDWLTVSYCDLSSCALEEMWPSSMPKWPSGMPSGRLALTNVFRVFYFRCHQCILLRD